MTERGETLRFLRNINPGSSCIEWPFSKTRAGYGQVRFQGRVRGAHQVSFILSNGREPRGLVRHTCDNPPCVNPAHLLEGTHADNMRDARERGRLPRFTERPNGKVTPELADEIRASAETGRSLAKRLGLSEGLISAIRTRRSHYDTLTGPWARVVGKVHPDD